MDFSTLASLIGLGVILAWKSGVLQKIVTLIGTHPIPVGQAVTVEAEVIDTLKAKIAPAPTDLFTKVLAHQNGINQELANFTKFVSQLQSGTSK